jgi:hypothetical protein
MLWKMYAENVTWEGSKRCIENAGGEEQGQI